MAKKKKPKKQPSQPYNDREVLEIFVESVKDLQNSSFVETIKREGISTKTETDAGSKVIGQIQ
jgi:hypothetical protein